VLYRFRSVVGDNLEGHEIWQQANINEQGLATSRLSGAASGENPVIALRADVHRQVSAAQGAFDPRAQTPVQNIRTGAQILRDLNAAPPRVIDEAEARALQHARSLGFK
jgi:hypothetical protein